MTPQLLIRSFERRRFPGKPVPGLLIVLLVCPWVSWAEVTTEPATDRPGNDYRAFDLPRAEPALCRDACDRDPRCRAYTYVRPGFQGPRARCYLKDPIPLPAQNDCCQSGVKNPGQGQLRADPLQVEIRADQLTRLDTGGGRTEPYIVTSGFLRNSTSFFALMGDTVVRGRVGKGFFKLRPFQSADASSTVGFSEHVWQGCIHHGDEFGFHVVIMEKDGSSRGGRELFANAVRSRVAVALEGGVPMGRLRPASEVTRPGPRKRRKDDYVGETTIVVSYAELWRDTLVELARRIERGTLDPDSPVSLPREVLLQSGKHAFRLSFRFDVRDAGPALEQCHR